MSAKSSIEIKDIMSFRCDPDNANRGTERGMALLDKSVSTDGAGRSLLATKDGVIIAGNKTQQALIDQGIEEVIVVHTDGTQAVIVQRDDVEHGTERAQRMAVYDNRSNEVGLDWSPEILASLNIDLTEMFSPYELSKIGLDIEVPPFNPEDEWKGMPEFENEDNFGAVASIKVHFASEIDIERFAEAVGQPVNKDTTWIWYPKQERENLIAYSVQDES